MKSNLPEREGKPSHQVAVIGFGNTIRGDDALGIAVVGSIQRRFERDKDPRLQQGVLTLRTAPSLNLGCEEELSRRSDIILVDAWQGGKGVVVRDLPNGAPAPTLTSHVSSPETLASLIEALHGHRPRIHLVAVSGKDFGLKEGLSPHAERSLHLAIVAVVDLINSILPPGRDQNPFIFD